MKRSIETQASVSRAAQRLFLDSAELCDSDILGTFVERGGSADISLVRAQPDNERWYARVRKDMAGFNSFDVACRMSPQ